MAIYNFGAGTLWATRTDLGANATPRKFGTLQSASVEMSASNKELFGSYQFPVAVGRGTCKVSGKAKFAQIQGSLLSDLYFNATPVAGQTTTANGEAGTVPASSVYTVTVTNSATWVTDLGVLYAATGLPFKRVASGPAVGQYSVAAGVYTFAAADASAAVLISYKYTIASTTPGQLTTITNQLIGTAPTFSLVLESLFSTAKSILTLNQCVSSKLSLETKLEDFVIPEMDFSAYADSANNLGTYNFNDLG